MSLQANVATINFGGINTSKSEFVNYSNPELMGFSIRNLENFKQYFNLDMSIRSFIDQYIPDTYPWTEKLWYIEGGKKIPHISKATTFKNKLISQAEQFFTQCMNDDLLAQMKTTDTDTFDLNNVSVGKYMTNILSKDKGIGGFEQYVSSRKCNLSSNLGTFTNGSSLDKDLFIEELFDYYNTTFISDITKLTSSTKPFSDFFMKGRNEGVDGSNRNYYNVGICRNDQFNTFFESVACLNMLLYDLITISLLSQHSEIPTSLIANIDSRRVNQHKMTMVADWFVNSKLDILFITECIPNIFDTKFTDDSIHVVYGSEHVGQCNAIIYKSKDGFITSTLEVIELENYTNSKEYKEPPLVLATKELTQYFVCYHANGKGITIDNQSIENSSFYKYIEGLEGKVIVGCDLNIDYYKVKSDIDTLMDVGNYGDCKTFSCFKQRSPLQSQYDKVGVFDKKLADFIITKGYTRNNKANVLKINSSGVETQILPKDNVIKTQYIIPSDDYPFDHYIVSDVVEFDDPNSWYNQFMAFCKSMFYWK